MTGAAHVTAESVGFGVGGRALVTDVSLELHPGRLTVLVGPNGAGKSTLIKLLTGEIAAQRGRVAYRGKDLRRLKPWQLACRRAVMAQGEAMSFPFTAHEIVQLGRHGIGRGTASAQAGAVERAMQAADVAHLAARRYQTLSGGERQRVQFARVLCQLEAGGAYEPARTLFLDEPVASLDLSHQIGLMKAVRAQTAAGVAALAVLHDLNLAIAHADELVILQQGRIVAAGPPQAVVTPQRIARIFDVDPALVRAGALPAVLPQGMPHDFAGGARLATSASR